MRLSFSSEGDARERIAEEGVGAIGGVVRFLDAELLQCFAEASAAFELVVEGEGEGGRAAVADLPVRGQDRGSTALQAALRKAAGAAGDHARLADAARVENDDRSAEDEFAVCERTGRQIAILEQERALVRVGLVELCVAGAGEKLHVCPRRQSLPGGAG